MLCPGWLLEISRNGDTETGSWEALFHEDVEQITLVLKKQG